MKKITVLALLALSFVTASPALAQDLKLTPAADAAADARDFTQYHEGLAGEFPVETGKHGLALLYPRLQDLPLDAASVVAKDEAPARIETADKP